MIFAELWKCAIRRKANGRCRKRQIAALHNHGSSTSTSGRRAHPHRPTKGTPAEAVSRSAAITRRHHEKGLASVQARRNHVLVRLPLLSLIAAPFSPRVSRHTQGGKAARRVAP